MTRQRDIRSVWMGRLVRLWLALLLPLAVFFAYQAFQYHETAAASHKLASKWYETQRMHDELGTPPTFDARAEQREMAMNAYSAEDKRNRFALASAALGGSPLLLFTLLALSRWAWGVQSGDGSRDKGDLGASDS